MSWLEDGEPTTIRLPPETLKLAEMCRSRVQAETSTPAPWTLEEMLVSALSTGLVELWKRERIVGGS